MIRDGNSVLLIHRFERGREYYLIPGGGFEPGESIREAAKREMIEETGLTVAIGNEVFIHEKSDRVEHYFPATSYSGEPRNPGSAAQMDWTVFYWRPERTETGYSSARSSRENIAALALDETPETDLSPFALSRFSG